MAKDGRTTAAYPAKAWEAGQKGAWWRQDSGGCGFGSAGQWGCWKRGGWWSTGTGGTGGTLSRPPYREHGPTSPRTRAKGAGRLSSGPSLVFLSQRGREKRAARAIQNGGWLHNTDTSNAKSLAHHPLGDARVRLPKACRKRAEACRKRATKDREGEQRQMG